MKTRSQRSQLIIYLLLMPICMILFQNCSENDGNSSPVNSDSPQDPNDPSLQAFDFVDPMPVASGEFGKNILQLPNGNIVIHSGGTNARGAIHIYEPNSETAFFSFYGDDNGDDVDRQVIDLKNGNFVVSSPRDDVGGDQDVGSVMLIDGSSGQQIGATLSGDNASDFMGSSSITPLSNGNFVVASEQDNVGGMSRVGSFFLVNGLTGLQIGGTQTGDGPDDKLGNTGVFELSNGNFVVVSEDYSPAQDRGRVHLIDGNSGAVIAEITGSPSDETGKRGAWVLPNGNFIYVQNTGQLALQNGSNGNLISIMTTAVSANFDSFEVTTLNNGNFVVNAYSDTVGGIVGSGSVRLFDGSTGNQIGATIAGDNTSDAFGAGSLSNGVVALTNGNFVVPNRLDDVGGVTNTGSVVLIDGSTGTIIGTPISGDAAGDEYGKATALQNGNYVISAIGDNVGGNTLAGTVILVDGTTGLQIGGVLSGDNAFDNFGSTIAPLSNGNYVIISQLDDVGGMTDAGSAYLVDGNTGLQIGLPHTGVSANDFFAIDGAFELTNGNIVLSSTQYNGSGLTDTGRVTLVNGTDFSIISEVEGNNNNDWLGLSKILLLSNGNFIIGSEFDDVDGINDAGSAKFHPGE